MYGFGIGPTPLAPAVPRVQPTPEELKAMFLAAVEQAAKRHQEAVEKAQAASQNETALVTAVLNAGEILDRALQAALQHGHAPAVLAQVSGLHHLYVEYLVEMSDGNRGPFPY